MFDVLALALTGCGFVLSRVNDIYSPILSKDGDNY
jgi:hypothetical protein